MRRALPVLPLVALLAACGGAAEEDARADQPAEEAVPAVTLDSFAGDWSGTLEVAGQRLPLVLHVDPYADVPVTLDSTAQGAFGLEASASVEDGALVAAWPDIGATYTATLAKAGDAISGEFAQSGQSFRLRMTRTAAPIAVPDRPQAVVGTPPYAVVTGSAESAPGTRLAYTLTLPEDADGPVPGVVLISGSGPQDRDETIAGHKPFAVLADRLTRAGVAVLRYDDRGTARSTGAFEGATSRDFAADAAAMLAELRREAGARGLTLSQAGLIGHSEGGLVAGLVAAETEAAPDFVVALAAPFVPMGEVLVRQTEDTLRARGATEAQIEASVAAQRRLVDAATTDGPPEAVCEAVGEAGAGLPLSVQTEARAFCAPWFYQLLRIDPVAVFAAADVPTLALFGSVDRQVAPEPNAAAARGVDGVEVEVVLGANHLFQSAQTGDTSEYGAIEETMGEDALDTITAWILARGDR